jgi:hypothetical protein
MYKKIVYPFLKDVRGHCTMYCTSYMYVYEPKYACMMHTLQYAWIFARICIILSTMKHNFSTMYRRYRWKVIELKTGNRIYEIVSVALNLLNWQKSPADKAEKWMRESLSKLSSVVLNRQFKQHCIFHTCSMLFDMTSLKVVGNEKGGGSGSRLLIE